MPFICLSTNEPLEGEAKQQLCAELSRACAAGIGKPEAYVMAIVHDGVTMLHAGKPGPAAWIDVRSIGGLSGDKNQALAATLCDLVSKKTKVPGARIYLNFTDVPASAWGHDGSTFG
jgi:phenylpyruvate tautomerase